MVPRTYTVYADVVTLAFDLLQTNAACAFLSVMLAHIYSAPDRGQKYCDERVIVRQ